VDESILQGVRVDVHSHQLLDSPQSLGQILEESTVVAAEIDELKSTSVNVTITGTLTVLL